MQELAFREISRVSGGHETNINLHDGLEIAGIITAFLGPLGGVIGAYCYSNVSFVTRVLLAASGISGLPIAIFAGIGVGSTVGFLGGLAAHYSGIITKADH